MGIHRDQQSDKGCLGKDLMESDQLAPILLVDDDPQALGTGRSILFCGGFHSLICCKDAREVPLVLSQCPVRTVLLDLSMPYVSGQEILDLLSREYPDIPVIIVTAANDVSTAVECMRQGAFDYLVKPVEASRMIASVRRALELNELRRENEALRATLLTDHLRNPEVFEEITTDHPTMRSIMQYAEAIAKTGKPVLITGETGVGKDLFAKAIHRASGCSGEFVPVNIGGLDDFAFSDTLFGHLKGAYTGAETARRGLIEQASDGTLFLDEIGELSQASQIKILRLLNQQEYRQLGSDVPKTSNARIIVATNQDLSRSLERETFRKDLYYRLQTHHIHIPPLRERMSDLPLLLERFFSSATSELGKKIPPYPAELLAVLSAYSFPGNVRELESMVFDCVAQHRTGRLSLKLFRDKTTHIPAVQGMGRARTITADSSFLSSLDKLPTLKEAAELLVEEALQRAKGNQTVASKILGITQSGLSKRLKRSHSLQD